MELQPDGTYTLRWMTGTKKIEPVKYFIRVRKEPYWWWFSKKQYYIETDFCTLGPFDSIEACMENLTLGGIGIRDVEIDV
jgi:hypothetical protein